MITVLIMFFIGEMLINSDGFNNKLVSDVYSNMNNDTSAYTDPELSIDSTMAILFADSVILYDPGAMGEGTGGEPDSAFRFPERATGLPDFSEKGDSSYVSLGIGGTIVLKFVDNVLIDGPGPDIKIFSPTKEESSALVWISEDCNFFIPIGKVSSSNNEIDIAGHADQGRVYHYIKLRDDSEGSEKDEKGLGYDIDAVSAIHKAVHMVISSDNLFYPQSSRFNEKAEKVLIEIIKNIEIVDPIFIKIESFTDSEGEANFNLIISHQQACRVRDYLIEKCGQREIIYSVTGWGEEKNIQGSDEKSRIEILIR